MKSMTQTVARVCSIAIIAILMTGAVVRPARADIERFAYTYEWFTPIKGELEIGVKHTQSSSNNLQDQFEAEYGVTDRYAIEAYANYLKDGGPYKYNGFQIEQRYRFGDYAHKKLLTAAYFEYEKLVDEHGELEAKAIFQYDPSSKSTFALNVIVTRPVMEDAKNEIGYSFGAAYFADRYDRYWYGVEAKGDFTSNQHFVGPSVGCALDNRTHLTATFAKVIAGPKGDEFRVLLSREIN
ncbi:MAG TPA: hypothetical protein VGK19_05615 [Capsulimonadaceae bacterium]|jgi:hypothetical protein